MDILDIQIKKGLLDACILAALEFEESYGYKIIDDTKHVITISESTLYPILKRLEQSGALSVRSSEYNGRLRKYYKITRLGLGRLLEFRNQMTGLDRVFAFINGGVR